MERIKYFDIAKGLLICCLLYGHMLIFARKEGINDSAIFIMQKSVPLYATFFMQSFFIITGFCSSFNQKFPIFLWRNVKALIIPSYLLVLVSYVLQILVWNKSEGASINFIVWFANGGPWFIVSLFWAKIIFYFVVKLSIRKQIIVLGLFYIVGLILNIVNIFPNYSYHRHVLLLTPYLYFGYYCKHHEDLMNKWLPYVAIFGVVSIFIQFVFSQFVSFYSIPTHDANISINKTFPIHIVNVISGTAAIIWLSQKINSNRFLETLGKGTLLIYLWNGLVNIFLLKLLPYPFCGGVLWQIFFHAVLYLLMLGTFYALVKIIYETKCLRWIVGKW